MARGNTVQDSLKNETPQSIQNNFIAGLKTEYTGLNFPENAATETYNCIFTMLGDITRRPGFDFEPHYGLLNLPITGSISNYRWLNAGGDGETQIFVSQIGATLYFYKSSDATTVSPLSDQLLASTVDITQFLANNSLLDPTDFECQYADGNGFLFVFHPACDPFYCTFSNNIITANVIDIKIRDFAGIPEPGVPVTSRLTTLSNDHNYNLANQGWTTAPTWTVKFTATGDATQDYPPLSFTGNGGRGAGPTIGVHSWTVPAGLPVTTSESVNINYTLSVYAYDINAVQWFTVTETGTATGVVQSYSGTTLTVNITSVSPEIWPSNWELNFPSHTVQYTISSGASASTITAWHTAMGNYPSNADIWFLYNAATTELTTTPTGSTSVLVEKFDPASTSPYVVPPTSPAPKGHYILDAFNQQRSTVSGISGLTPIVTSKRPRTGAWFQGRIWYTGVDDSVAASGDAPFYTWTENIYFSQIVTDTSGTQFGQCYQTDDPTDEKLFLLLPSDGGVITIQGSGAIFKLFPIQNGMIVFAANGVWFITGSTGIGFTANDYTITKISAVRSISSTSFVDVNGLPVFWNEEGIYAVEPAQQGLGLVVNPLTVGTIRSFYKEIPYQSKLYARGSYDPVNYVVQWVYNDVNGIANNVTDVGGQVVVPGEYNFYLFDSSCHLFSSTDGLGVNWSESTTPLGIPSLGMGPVFDTFDNLQGVGTVGDDWTDMQMAINDQDYSTMAAWDFSYDGGFGILGVSTQDGATGTWNLRDPEPGNSASVNPNSPNFFSSYAEYISGAVGINGLILSLPEFFFDPSVTNFYPRISRDFGVTWHDVTGVPPNVIWSRACMSAGGTTMYMKPSGYTGNAFTGATIQNPARIYKSTDSGATWNQLAGGPTYNGGANADQDYETNMRLRCSSDGTIVGLIGADGNFWLSKNGGSSWTTTNVPSLVWGGTNSIAGRGRADFGMSTDGQIIIVGCEMQVINNFWPGVILSTDGGTTWTNISATITYPTTSTPPPANGSSAGNNPSGFTQCNVSPDGRAMVVTFDGYNDSYNPQRFVNGIEQFIGYATISFDRGQTWKTVTFNVDPTVFVSPTGIFVGVYVVPHTASTGTGGKTVVSSPEFAFLQRSYNSVLNLNTFTKAFYPWTISEGPIQGQQAPYVHDVKYVQNPGGEGAPDGIFKYPSSVQIPNGTSNYTFSECSDLNYVDWDYATETIGDNYDSYFITGFKLDGQGLRKFQPNYVNMFSRNDVRNAYTIQGIWDFATDRKSNKTTAKQLTFNDKPFFGMVRRRHKIRGHGYALQFKVSSIDNIPFDIMGWSVWETQNQGV